MDRSKVLELARKAKISIRGHYDETGSTPQELDRFAAFIEAEVRKDAEPVACIAANGALMWLKRPETLYSKPVPLFKHPAPAASAESVASVYIKDGCLIGSQRKSGVDMPDGQYGLYPIGTYPAPAVVRQLVDGLAGLIDFIEIDNLKIGHVRLGIAKAALAAAKEAGL